MPTAVSQRRKNHRTFKSRLLACVVAPLFSTSLYAQQIIDIPAQPLSEALKELGQQSGLQIIYDADVVTGKQSQAIKGAYEAEDALKILLRGKNINFTINGDSVTLITIVDSAMLPEVMVKASSLGSVTEGTGAYTTGFMNAATGLNLSYRETPQSTSVVSSQLIEDQNQKNIGQALSVTPGLWVDASDESNIRIESRGFDLTSVQLDGLTAGSINHFENAPSYLAHYNTASVDHIEVVRGATGIMSGHGDPSGTVNIVRKRPSDEFKFSVGASASSYERFRTTVDVGGPLVPSGILAGRVVLVADEQNDDVRTGDYNASRPAFYGILDAKLTDKTTLSLALDHQEVNIDGFSRSKMAAWDPDGNQLSFSRSLELNPDWNTIDQYDQSVMISLVHEFSDNWRLRSSYAQRQGKMDYLTSEVNLSRAPWVEGGELDYISVKGDTKTEDNSFNFVVNGDFDAWGQNHELIVGFTDREQKFVDKAYMAWGEYGPVFGTFKLEDYDPSSTIAKPTEFMHLDTTTADITERSFYANSQLKATDTLTFLIGARVSDFKQDQVVTGMGDPNPVNYDHSGVFLPYLGVIYDINDTLSAYASYTENFEIQANDVLDEDGNLLDPKESKNKEVGLKAELFDEQLTASVALFRVNEENVGEIAGTYQDPITNELKNTYIPGDGVETQGVEFEVAGQVTSDWLVMAGYTHQETDRQIVDGRIRGFSEDLFKFSTRYKMNDSLAMGGSLKWNGGYSALRSFGQDEFGNDRTVKAKQDAFALVGLWANYQLNNHFSAQFNVSNLFDEKYLTGLSRSVIYGEDRRFDIAIKYDF